MANLTVTSAEVAVTFPNVAEIYDFIAAEDITAGQAVYINSSGKVALANAVSASGKNQVRGIALSSVAAGQSVSVLRRGHVSGFDLSGMGYDDSVYLSDTDGALADSAGTVTILVGRVIPLSDNSLTKTLYVDCEWLNVW